MSIHDDVTVTCYGEDDENNVHAGHPPRTLRFEEHGRFVRSAPRERFEGSGLAFDCPECGNVLWRCPVCSDGHGGPGWFRGESTGKMLACHNCNAVEAERQRRAP